MSDQNLDKTSPFDLSRNDTNGDDNPFGDEYGYSESISSHKSSEQVSDRSVNFPDSARLFEHRGSSKAISGDRTRKITHNTKTMFSSGARKLLRNSSAPTPPAKGIVPTAAESNMTSAVTAPPAQRTPAHAQNPAENSLPETPKSWFGNIRHRLSSSRRSDSDALFTEQPNVSRMNMSSRSPSSHPPFAFAESNASISGSASARQHDATWQSLAGYEPIQHSSPSYMQAMNTSRVQVQPEKPLPPLPKQEDNN
jgi:hypothetical protein